jgi:hypothetical protein
MRPISNQQGGKTSGRFKVKKHRFQPWNANSQKIFQGTPSGCPITQYSHGKRPLELKAIHDGHKG